MAFCDKCGEKMEEILTYTPKTHKQNGSEFHCPIHGFCKKPVHNYIGKTNPNNHACRDWGTIIKN